MKWAKVRKVDYKLVELNDSKMDFSTTDFIEVPTNEIFNDTDDYVFNPSASSFYNVGVKQVVANPEKQAVVQSPFASADNFRFRGQGYSGIAEGSPTLGETKVTTIDWVIAEERFINGTHVMLKGHTFEDCYSVSVVDKDFLYAGVLYDEKYVSGETELDWPMVFPDGLVLDNFINDWHVVEDMQGQKPIKLEYPARLLAGLYIRLTYKAFGLEDISVKLNGFLHLKSASE